MPSFLVGRFHNSMAATNMLKAHDDVSVVPKSAISFLDNHSTEETELGVMIRLSWRSFILPILQC